ncbi:amino acid ABC transporter membrane protein 2 (PAAT family) [Homoserinimonas aerilata]|uniref:Amino acid ABC transporter membrane protein 2 (PAAT family) n=1 Tax=Homoserinimonas aerilata TaxID=1162970 RepID=A0A542YJU2_9MICO|nr:amino acid ABC transporter permease [Homoserinimonas aerilata]TQL48342.1 amino acid ABC transporter membrane protein 2 (PAAT family) [Homoserinimonas aerilata]
MTSVLYDAPGPRARRRSLIISIVGVIAIVGGLVALVMGLAAPRVLPNGAESPGLLDGSRWDIFLDVQIWRLIGEGLLATLRMAGVAAVFAIIVGILFSFGRSANSRWIRLPSTVLLEFFRGMPVLLMILFILLVLGVEPFWAGTSALAIYNGAIIGEALRAGIQALPAGQRESGLALGLTRLRTRFIIEFPQAFRQMLPIIIAQLVVLLKDTALAYIVGYPELLRTTTTYIANYVGNRYMFSLFFVALAIYLVMNLILSWVARFVARRSGPKLGKTGPETPTVLDGPDGVKAAAESSWGSGHPN